MIAKPTDLNTAPIIIVQEPAKPEKPEPAKGIFSKWTWTQMAKYGAATVLIAAAAGLAYSQLWQTAQKIPEVAKAVHSAFTDGASNVASAFNDGIDASKGFYQGVGQGVSWIRQGAASLGAETPPVPTTPESITGLGLTYVNNAWSWAGVLAANLVYLAPVAALAKPLLPKPGRTFAVTALSALAVETAVPGIANKTKEGFLNGYKQLRNDFPLSLQLTVVTTFVTSFFIGAFQASRR